MKETIKLGVTLLIIAAVAAGILAYSNSITGPIIAEREKEERYGALLNIFPDADEFVEIEEDKLAEVQETHSNITEILEVKSGGSIIGYAISNFAGGYGGDVNVVTGINATDNTIAGISIGSHSETPDLGDKIEDPSFTDTYKGKPTTEKLVAVGSPSAANEVQQISGATISSFAVLTAVNDANDAYLRYFTDIEVAPIVEETEEEKQERLISELFPEADEFTEIEENILEAKSGGNLLGYVIMTTSKGYGGEVPVLTGINVDGTLSGIRVGTNSETPGLGTKIEEAAFTDTFAGKAATGDLKAVASPSAENEVQMISGATVSTEAAVKAVNEAINIYQVKFTNADVEPIVEETEEEKQAKLLGELFPDADEFTEVNENVKEAKAGGELLGYIISTSSKGYGGDVPVLTGVSTDGKLTGIRVGENSETPGLGTKIEEAEFTDTFVGKGTDSELKAVASPSAEDEVLMISGATVSTKAVVKAVNEAIEIFGSLN
ncbi:MAG: RnfABCDGE type electron transport complex subunit G [Tissierellaceae bacterium]|jgi:electron transport complex protein RnfG